MYQFVRSLAKLGRQPSHALDLIRIFLGVALTVRGILFVTDSSTLQGFMSHPDRDWFFPIAVAHYVTLAHLGGGILLTLGFMTRVAAAIQIPVLLGAVFFVHLRDGLMTSGQSLELSLLVLFLLVISVVFRPGKLSFDHYFATDPDRNGKWEELRPSKPAPLS